jgi:TonB family protein
MPSRLASLVKCEAASLPQRWLVRLLIITAALCASVFYSAACLGAQSAPPQRLKVDLQVEMAQKISGKDPVYPPIAVSAGIEGSLRIQFVVATDGTTKEILYSSGPPLLMKAAIDAIRTWRFKPTLAGGAPVEVQTIATVNFFLGPHGTSKRLAPYRKAVEKNPNDPKAHVALGRQMLILGQIEDAIGEFRQAISIQPGDATAHFGLGDALRAKGDEESEIKEYQQGLSLNPSDADAHFHLATLLDGKGDLKGAISESRLGLQLEPKLGYRHYNLGILLMRTGDPDGAMQEFNQALHHGTDIPAAHFQLGRALEQKGDLDAASKEYQKACKQDPTNLQFKASCDRLAAKPNT